MKTPSWLLALGAEPVPATIEVGGRTHRLERIFKHDFFAYTALYREATAPDRAHASGVVLKIGRKASFFGLPLAWIGRWNAAHESAVFREVDDLEIVPRFTGRWGKHGFTHEFIEGHPLQRGERVPDDFFARLEAGLAEIHRRKLAYVDLEKSENVLVGDDGRPYLFDFQISWRWPRRFGGDLWPVAWTRHALQASDRYHLKKHQRRSRPDQLTPAELAAAKPRLVRLYTGLTRPFTLLRRLVLKRIDPERERRDLAPSAPGDPRPPG